MLVLVLMAQGRMTLSIGSISGSLPASYVMVIHHTSCLIYVKVVCVVIPVWNHLRLKVWDAMVLRIGTTKAWRCHSRRVYLIEFHIDKSTSIMKVWRKCGSTAVIILLSACLSLTRQSPTLSMLHWALDRYFGGGTRLGYLRVLYESLLHWNITVGALR